MSFTPGKLFDESQVVRSQLWSSSFLEYREEYLRNHYEGKKVLTVTYDGDTK